MAYRVLPAEHVTATGAGQSCLFDPPALERRTSTSSPLARQIANLEGEIAYLEGELERAQDELDELRSEADAWPTKDVLLALYGPPGLWPVEARP